MCRLKPAVLHCNQRTFFDVSRGFETHPKSAGIKSSTRCNSVLLGTAGFSRPFAA